jgi:hypothetical protein
MIRIPGSGQGYAKTISFGLGLAQELCAASNSSSGDFVAEMVVEAVVAAHRHGVPFGFAQGRLSTSFGWRLTSLSMTNEPGRNVGKCTLEKTAGVRDGTCGIGTLRWREFFPDRCEFRYALQTAVSFLRTSSIE